MKCLDGRSNGGRHFDQHQSAFDQYMDEASGQAVRPNAHAQDSVSRLGTCIES